MDSNQEWDQRVLCPNENCIGLLSTNATCGLCGFGKAPVLMEEPAELAARTEVATTDDFALRHLCPNDNCIGVLDTNQRCALCGSQATT